MSRQTNCNFDLNLVNVQNRTLFHGDNLEFMRGINSGSIDLIATDPPFNKGRTYEVRGKIESKVLKFKDSWNWNDVDKNGLVQLQYYSKSLSRFITNVRSLHSESMAAYLCYMSARIIEMHRILKVTGSIYLHCDSTASHYLKIVMDLVFGRNNFQNELVWYYSGGGASKKRWARKHDVLLFYSKGKIFCFNADNVRVPYRWIDGQKRADGSDRNYNKGKLADDVWEHHSLMPWDVEKIGYPTQKPLLLYERIIKASSNEGDVVFDPFCGSCTTLVAAEKLYRKWIGSDIWETGYTSSVNRLLKEGLDVSYNRNKLFPVGEITFTKKVPIRTDKFKILA